MQLLMQGLLAYCRVETKGTDFIETSSAAALKEALVKLRGAIEDSGAVVTHDPLPTVTADGVQLVQLFENLVGNAIKYHGVDLPRVHVSAKRNGDGEWIFSDPRQRDLESTPSTSSGFSLCISGCTAKAEKSFPASEWAWRCARRLRNATAAGVWVESALGNGSTFYVALPDGEAKMALTSWEEVSGLVPARCPIDR